MKPLGLLVAAVYVVSCTGNDDKLCSVRDPQGLDIIEVWHKEDAEDLAAALNEAHEKRLLSEQYGEPSSWPTMEPSPRPCSDGQGSCGKEPK